ncbi:J domain-containing protein [Endozoicomonas sp. SESOKO1]|uniref:J domain-containing protein n=1 Tax=Endozoicomonas sp. SESOKO1 TaxID=2828742 RepID=UPI0021472A57|nr:J domain-containing protein [Endozoicomonas sp. SESOKO1]
MLAILMGLKMQDHYKVLGLTPDVEDAVIKAAYRALCKKYHPDKYSGDKMHATELMKKINVAYETLSHPKKREEYDNSWGKSSDYETNTFKDEYNADEEIENEWNFATEYYPKLLELHNHLCKISLPLGYAFKLLIIDSKEFGNPNIIAAKLEHQFLEKYFGTKKVIQNTALKYILNDNRIAARELNKAVKVFGESLDEHVVLNKIKKKFPFKNRNNKADNKYQEAQSSPNGMDKGLNAFIISLGILFFIVAVLPLAVK